MATDPQRALRSACAVAPCCQFAANIAFPHALEEFWRLQRPAPRWRSRRKRNEDGGAESHRFPLRSSRGPYSMMLDQKSMPEISH
jgi:hypothetical protein